MPDLFIRSVHQIRSSVTFQSSFFKGVGFAVFLTEVSLLFCFAFYAADANNTLNLSIYFLLAHSVFFFRTPLFSCYVSSNFIILHYFYLHTVRGVVRAPNTHSLQCSIAPDYGYKRRSTNRDTLRAYTQPKVIGYHVRALFYGRSNFETQRTRGPDGEFCCKRRSVFEK